MKQPKNKLDSSTLPFATISELGTALRSRDVSSSELTKIFTERLRKLGPHYNAVACLFAKDAKRASKDIDQDIKRERFRSPLQGIPCAVKDLLSVADYPTTWGAKPYAEQVFDYDATVVKRLADVQSPVLAKLSMIELAGGGGYHSASASLQGPCLNPWNTQYWTGGSSSGSGAAVAAGLVPFAIGSETSGSILNPAAYCGITGLRPTYGLVSRHGAMSLSWTLDKIGVLAHSANDCGLVLHAIAGADDADPASARKSFYYSNDPTYQRKWTDLKFGYAEIDFAEWPDPPLRPAFQAALSVIKAVGSQMVETKLPDLPYGPVAGCIIDSEAASIFETLIRSDQLHQLADPGQIAGLRASLQYSAIDYLKAMRVRTQVQSAFHAIFADVDLLVAPTYFNTAERADQPFDETPPRRPDIRGVGSHLIPAANLAGLPGLTIPCGFANGLPVGLQIVGPPFSENTILALGREFQARTDFHRQHPPMPT